MGEFLQLVGVTVESFLSTYEQDLPAENSEEVQFVLSLCGTVTSEGGREGQRKEGRGGRKAPMYHSTSLTDVAASAYGRDFLSTHPEGKALLETLSSVLSSSPLSPHW